MTTDYTQMRSVHEMPPVPQQKSGCLKWFIGFLIFILLGIVGIWVTLKHTSLPLRALASMIEKTGEPVGLKIEGVGGSVNSGISLKSVTWDGGELQDVRFRYSGLNRLMDDKELIIEEMHVGKAVIESVWDDGTVQDELTSGQTEGEGAADEQLRLFRIDKLTLNNLTFKDLNSERSLHIALISWTGLHVEGNKTEFGELQVKSDLVDIQTGKAEAPFQKTFQIAFKAGPSGYVLKPFEVTAKAGQVGEKMISEVSGFEGLVTIASQQNETERFVCNGVNLADYLDMPLPQGLTLEAEVRFAADEMANHVTLKGEPFRLGLRTFEIQAVDMDLPPVDQRTEPLFLEAICREGGRVVRYRLSIEDMDKGKAVPILVSEPAMSQEDLMAWIYFDKANAELTPEEQAKVTRYLGWVEVD